MRTRDYKNIAVVVTTFVITLFLSSNVALCHGRLKSETKNFGKMVLIPSGTYTPFYKESNQSNPVKISSFYIDEFPVTNKEFLDFVKASPQWQRSKVKKLFADNSYLREWKSDLEPGPMVNENGPVTNVSWFAAKAYAEWKGKRLPTINEWEYAASASSKSPNAQNDISFKQQILEWYSKPAPEKLPAVGTGAPNYYGVYNLHGLVWEWTDDFNSVLSTGESRGDGGAIDGNLFCGGAAVKSVDPGNYAAFMRYAMRSSLKANYTVHNLGFRCVKDIEKN